MWQYISFRLGKKISEVPNRRKKQVLLAAISILICIYISHLPKGLGVYLVQKLGPHIMLLFPILFPFYCTDLTIKTLCTGLFVYWAGYITVVVTYIGLNWWTVLLTTYLSIWQYVTMLYDGKTRSLGVVGSSPWLPSVFVPLKWMAGVLLVPYVLLNVTMLTTPSKVFILCGRIYGHFLTNRSIILIVFGMHCLGELAIMMHRCYIFYIKNTAGFHGDIGAVLMYLQIPNPYIRYATLVHINRIILRFPEVRKEIYRTPPYRWLDIPINRRLFGELKKKMVEMIDIYIMFRRIDEHIGIPEKETEKMTIPEKTCMRMRNLLKSVMNQLIVYHIREGDTKSGISGPLPKCTMKNPFFIFNHGCMDYVNLVITEARMYFSVWPDYYILIIRILSSLVAISAYESENDAPKYYIEDTIIMLMDIITRIDLLNSTPCLSISPFSCQAKYKAIQDSAFESLQLIHSCHGEEYISSILQHNEKILLDHYLHIAERPIIYIKMPYNK